MKNLKEFSNEDLVALWWEKKEAIRNKGIENCTQEDMDELLAMKREIDKRKGERPPQIHVNFEEKYLTD